MPDPTPSSPLTTAERERIRLYANGVLADPIALAGEAVVAADLLRFESTVVALEAENERLEVRDKGWCEGSDRTQRVLGTLIAGRGADAETIASLKAEVAQLTIERVARPADYEVPNEWSQRILSYAGIAPGYHWLTDPAFVGMLNDIAAFTRRDILALEAEVARLSLDADRLRERTFPIQDGPNIPWSAIAPFDKQAQAYHGGQDLEKLASRGGLGVHEAIHVLRCQKWFGPESDAILAMPLVDAIPELLRLAARRPDPLLENTNGK